jgi:hypothetical protein
MSFYAKAQREWIKRNGFRCPYMALMIAADQGKGLRLSAADCRYLVEDSAITTVASNHYDEMIEDEAA